MEFVITIVVQFKYLSRCNYNSILISLTLWSELAEQNLIKALQALFYSLLAG